MKGNEHCADMITKGIYSKSHWGFITEYGGKFFMPVTHWMSLPKAPIEKAHGIGVSK
jgi:hypothetical protein